MGHTTQDLRAHGPARTVILTHSDLVQVVDQEAVVNELRAAFISHRPTTVARRVGVSPDNRLTAMVLVGGIAPGVPAYTVKVHAKNPSRRPAVSGVICLHDRSNGALSAGSPCRCIW